MRNRAPLAANVFYPLPLGAIRPGGWLRGQLEIQANGLSGHLDETWADVGPNSGWLGGTGESWERGPYFLDGLVPLGMAARSTRASRPRRSGTSTGHSNNQAPNGMIGPRSNDDWWPRIVMLKALTQYQEFTGDPRVIPVMERYFRISAGGVAQAAAARLGQVSLAGRSPQRHLALQPHRSQYLLDLVRLLHEQGYDWVAEFADFQYTERDHGRIPEASNEGDGLKDLALATHGVNNGQAVKTGPVWSLVSGSAEDRSRRAQNDRRTGQIPRPAQWHVLLRRASGRSEPVAGIGTMHRGGVHVFARAITCALPAMRSLGDQLERLAFNALPGTLTDDMWAHQYNQEPNQVECSLHRKPWTTDGPESNLYGLEPNFGCCTANFHQGWPKLAASLF